MLRLEANRDAEAAAWLWEIDFLDGLRRGAANYSGIAAAAAAQPRRARWKAWAAAARLCEWTVADARPPRGELARALALAREAAESDPRCLSALVVYGLLSEISGEPSALRAMEAASRLAPWAAPIHRRVAGLLWRLGDSAGYVARSEAALYADEGVGYFEKPLEVYQARGYRDRVEAAGRFLSENPNAYWMLVYRGDCRRTPEVNDQTGGHADHEAAVRINPDCAYAWAYLSRARLSHASASSAVDAIDRAVRLRPTCGWIRIWRGETRRRLGDVRGALQDLDAGLELDPDYELGYSWRGGVNRTLGRVQRCLSDLAIAGALVPDHAWTHQELSLAHRERGRTDDALLHLARAHRLDAKFVWSSARGKDRRALAELNGEIRRHPSNAAAWAWRGQSRLRAGHWSAAKSDLDRAVRLDPRNGWAWAWRARAYHKLGRLALARRFYDRALELEPLYAPALAWRGRLRHRLGDFPGALEDLSRAVVSDKKTSWIFQWKAQTEEELARDGEAEEDYTLSLAIDPKNFSALLGRCALRLRTGDLEGADRDCSAALALSPADPGALWLRAAVADRAGRWNDARGDYKAALHDARRLTRAQTATARRFLRRGPVATEASVRHACSHARRLIEEGRHLEAADVCAQILKAAPDCREALELRAESYRCSGEYGPMLSDRDRLVRLTGSEPAAVINRGVARRIAGDYQGALSDAELALGRRGPTLASALILKSEALRNLGLCESAVDAASLAIARDPGLSWAHVVRGKARRQSGDLNGAIVDFSRAVELSPDDAKAHGWLADARRKARQLDAAFDAARRAVELMPSCAWAVALLGEITRERGDKGEGLSLIRRAVAIDAQASCSYDFLGADPPSVRNDRDYAWVYAWRGGVSRKSGRLDRARADLLHSVALDPDCFWARAWLGECRLASSDARAAMADLTAALDAFSGYSDAWNWLARAHAEFGRWRQALAAHRKALAIDPTDPWAMLGSSLCLERLGRRAAAADMLLRVQAQAPNLISSLATAR